MLFFGGIHIFSGHFFAFERIELKRYYTFYKLCHLFLGRLPADYMEYIMSSKIYQIHLFALFQGIHFYSYLQKKVSIVSDYHAVHVQVVNRKNQGYGLPADIWSLGCTVLEMLTRQIPYAELECVRVMLFFSFFLLGVYCYDDGDVVYVLVKHVLLLQLFRCTCLVDFEKILWYSTLQFEVKFSCTHVRAHTHAHMHVFYFCNFY